MKQDKKWSSDQFNPSTINTPRVQLVAQRLRSQWDKGTFGSPGGDYMCCTEDLRGIV
jgi:hypothetical protein